MTIEQKLAAQGITLPTSAPPAAAYVMHVQTGNMVFLSGHLAKKDGQIWVGQFGKNIATDEGKPAARAVAIDLMATLQAACGGDLTRVKRIVKLMSLVKLQR
jgi:enamine deaminase RidA (YjgF/YER057c/UK114 family)